MLGRVSGTAAIKAEDFRRSVNFRSTRGRLRLLAGLLLLVAQGLLTSASFAHETPIALLELRETSPGSFFVEWTYSSSTNMQAPSAVYPTHCTVVATRVNCGDTGLYGELGIERLGLSYSAAVVRISRIGEDTQSITLTGAQNRVTLTQGGKLPLSQVIRSYVPLGFEHIMLGVDHLLFVFGLLLLVRGTWPLVSTITMFTVAHSLSLAAATFGWIGVPERAVNVCIALSIVVVAVEILRERNGHPSWSVERPWLVAFGFGLLHGLGFASALTDIGLPEENIPSALLFFNVGVELGQLGFVLLVLALGHAHRRLQATLSPRFETAGVYAMGIVAAYWFAGRFMAIVAPMPTL